MNDALNHLEHADDIAVVGMALNVPGAQTLTQYWANLSQGVESIRKLTEAELLAAGESPAKIKRKNYVPSAAVLDGFETFDGDFFGFSPKDSAILDPQHRKFLEVAWTAIEQAGHVPENVEGPIGVYAGCGMGSYFYFNICSNPDLVEDTGMFLLRHTGNDKDFLSTRVSHVFDLTGPSINLQTACSTSLVAIHYAAQALRSGEVEMAVAGGVTIELPQGRGYLFQENEILSPDGHCHAFDHRAQGTVFGSGAGAVVLKRLADARRDGDHIWAVLKGSAVNNDGAAKAGYLAPSVDGQSAAIGKALADAKVSADSIGYVECHGTGTYLGDPIEVAALTEAYRKDTDMVDFCKIGSVKTNIGHLDTAAGVAGFIKTALALHHKQIPPSLGYEAPNPAIGFEGSPFSVADRLQDWPAQGPRRAAVNALGVGGTNAHVILQEAPLRPASEESDFPFHVLCLSGRNKAALDANTAALVAHLKANPQDDLADIAWTLKNARRGFEKRRVVVAHSAEGAVKLLEENDPRQVFSHDVVGETPDVVFMFPGGGAQYPNMARDLYETEPVFAEWMDRGLDHLQTKLEYDIRALWLCDTDAEAEAAERLQKPSAQLPLIMIVEYALAQLWQSWAVRPAMMVGHSMGENTAACVAGVIGFEDCIDLVLLRGQLFDTVPAGGMLSISASLSEIEPLLGHDIDIASINGPELIAVSGPQEGLHRLADSLRQAEISFQRVQIDIAAHSRMLDPILEQFGDFLRRIPLAAPAMPFMSNRTGEVITAAQATDPEYWVGQLRNTVMFADCMTTLAARKSRIFLEVGPGKALSALAGMCADVKAGQVVNSLRHPDQAVADDTYFIGSIGRLWACGLEADWDQIWGEARRNRMVLPTYQFQRAPYFIEPGKVSTAAEPAELTRRDDMRDWGYVPSWRPALANIDADVTDVLQETALDWLIFEDRLGQAEALADRLRAAGHRVALVAVGDTFAQQDADHFTLSTAQGRDGFDQLLTALADADRLPQRIVHMWLLNTGEDFRAGSNQFDHNLEAGFYALVWLAQALADQAIEAVHVSVVTNGAAALKGELLESPEKALIAGPAGTWPHEMPGVSVATLDVEPQVSDLIDRLLEDVLAEPANRVACYRGTKRFEQTYRPRALEAVETVPYAEGGTYLITGGFGGIGMSVARDLVARVRANIVLLARQDLPPRDQWQGWIARHAPQDAVSQRIAMVQELEAQGAEVLVCSGDVANVAQMRRVLAAVETRFGSLNGVFHAAGVIDDGPLLAKTGAGMARVLDPKVQGLRVLDSLLPDGALDLLVLFSSTSTATRAAGQADYVAANEYLNAYAKARQQDETRVFAINWGVWADVGMAAEAVSDTDATPELLAPLPDQPLLDQVGFDAQGRRVFQSVLDARRDWILDQHRTKNGDAILPGTGYLELAAQALNAHEAVTAFELHDLYFLRALSVPDTDAQTVRVELTEQKGGYGFEVRSAASFEGRAGTVLHAEARLAPVSAPRPGPVDLAAIDARCDQRAQGTAEARLTAPQEVHLAFGTRWHVLNRTALGVGEGLAHLMLPAGTQGDIGDGFLIHPGLMDIATGWAMGLIDGYGAEHLWVPGSYGKMTVYAPLPAEIFSHVRLGQGTDRDSGIASFDVTLTDPQGRVLIDITGFTIRRIEGRFGNDTPPEARDIRFDQAVQHPRSAAEERLAFTVSQGIQPDQGAEALRRAMALDLPQVFVSSLDLQGLIQQASQPAGQEPSQGQTFERPDLDGNYVAPTTAIQEELATMWQTLLGISQVGIEDSFFDLGGHSLIAVRLFAAVKKHWGADFPISVLFEAPTITDIALLIEAEVGPETAPEQTSATVTALPKRFTHIVPLHPNKTADAAPLFLVAGMFGNVLNLRHLALGVGRDRAVYGLQARGLIGDAEPHLTIAAAAADYIAEMRQVQPEGPYLIGGFSGGGVTAYEIAQQLKAAGQEIAVLAMLDTPLPVRPSLSRHDRALIKMQQVRERGLSYVSDWLEARRNWKDYKERYDGDAQAPGAEFNNQKIEAAFLAAVGSYETLPWDGNVTLFRPPLDQKYQVSGGNWVSAAREYVFHDNDWTKYAPQLRVIEVPGDHDSMVLSPNVTVLADELLQVIEAATGRPETHAAWVSAKAAE